MKTVVAVYPDPERPKEFIVFYSDGSMYGIRSYAHVEGLVTYSRGKVMT